MRGGHKYSSRSISQKKNKQREGGKEKDKEREWAGQRCRWPRPKKNCDYILNHHLLEERITPLVDILFLTISVFEFPFKSPLPQRIFANSFALKKTIITVHGPRGGSHSCVCARLFLCTFALSKLVLKAVVCLFNAHNTTPPCLLLSPPPPNECTGRTPKPNASPPSSRFPLIVSRHTERVRSFPSSGRGVRTEEKHGFSQQATMVLIPTEETHRTREGAPSGTNEDTKAMLTMTATVLGKLKEPFTTQRPSVRILESPSLPSSIPLHLPLPELTDSVKSTASSRLSINRGGSTANYTPLQRCHTDIPLTGGNAIASPHSDIAALSDIHRLALLEAATAGPVPAETSGEGEGEQMNEKSSKSFSSSIVAPLTPSIDSTREGGSLMSPTWVREVVNGEVYTQGTANASSSYTCSSQACSLTMTSLSPSADLQSKEHEEGEGVEEEKEGNSSSTYISKSYHATASNTLPVIETTATCPPSIQSETAAVAPEPPSTGSGQRIKRLLRLNFDEAQSHTLPTSGNTGHNASPTAFTNTGSNRTVYMDDRSGMTILQMSDGDIVRFENVQRKDGRITAHIQVAHRFAIGSKGMYTYPASTFDRSNTSYCSSLERGSPLHPHLNPPRAHPHLLPTPQHHHNNHAHGNDPQNLSASGHTTSVSHSHMRDGKNNNSHHHHKKLNLCLSTSYPPPGGLIDDMGDNLLELGFLGRGAGSIEVVKALHFPSMRMVAVKKVPIDNQAKLSQAIHELEQLMGNQVTIRERIADDSTRVDPNRSSRMQDEREGGREYCPFIVSLYDAYKQQSQLCLVMEYMNGGSLQDLVEKGGSTDEELLAKIAYNVLRGLHYLHSQGKIHRDVKPGNLLINTKNFVKLADFGLAASLDKVKSPTVGTNRYIPPELLDSLVEDEEEEELARTERGMEGAGSAAAVATTPAASAGTPNPLASSGRWSTKGDIWSFGLSLWAITEGQRPFSHVPDDEILIAATVIDDPAPRVSVNFSAEFRDFVDQCLLKNPSERASAKALLQHPFIRSKAYVHLNERELSHVARKVTQYFQTHPDKALLTPAMVRALAQEVHLDERYVGEHLREAFEGLFYVDATMGPPPLTPPRRRRSGNELAVMEGRKGTRVVGEKVGEKGGNEIVRCCVLM